VHDIQVLEMVDKCREEYSSVYKPMCDKLAEERRNATPAEEKIAVGMADLEIKEKGMGGSG
jgi:hypothetical protein